MPKLIFDEFKVTILLPKFDDIKEEIKAREALNSVKLAGVLREVVSTVLMSVEGMQDADVEAE